MNRVRIAYLISRYPAVSHTFILREIVLLRSMGTEIEVASINDPEAAADGPTEIEEKETSQTYYIKSRGFAGALKANAAAFFRRPIRYLAGLFYAVRQAGADLGKLTYHFFYFVEAAMVGVWMEKKGMDHLHVHFASQAATVALFASRTFPITFSISVHGPDEFYEVQRFLLPEKIKRAKFIVCIGNFAKSQLMRVSDPDNWPKIHVAPLGVDPEVFHSRELSVNPVPFNILFVARLTATKGHRVLLEAAKRLRSHGKKIRLQLVGDGEERESLEAAVNELGLDDTVVFEGAVDQQRIRDFYQNADLFVLPSFAEGIPVVLMEAMASGVPCVSTWITGIPELIRDGIDGVLVSPSDVDALAKEIEYLIDHPEERRRYSEAGRKRVLEKFDINPNTARLERIFRERLLEVDKEIPEGNPHRLASGMQAPELEQMPKGERTS